VCVGVNKLKDRLSQEAIVKLSLEQWYTICRNLHYHSAKWFCNVYLRVRWYGAVTILFICKHSTLPRYPETNVTIRHGLSYIWRVSLAGWLISVTILIWSEWKRIHDQRCVRTSDLSIQDGHYTYVQLWLLIIWRYVYCKWVRLSEGRDENLPELHLQLQSVPRSKHSSFRL
jgi:hypothetical protein